MKDTVNKNEGRVKSDRTDGIIVEIICWLLIILFFFSGLDKFVHYQKFSVELGKNPMLTSFASFLAWFVPTTEMVISVLLAIANTRLVALYASFSLMTMFTTYTIIMMLNYQDVVCSCNGIMESMGWTAHLIVNSVYTILAAVGILLEARNERPKIKIWPLPESVFRKKQLFINP